MNNDLNKILESITGTGSSLDVNTQAALTYKAISGITETFDLGGGAKHILTTEAQNFMINNFEGELALQYNYPRTVESNTQYVVNLRGNYAEYTFSCPIKLINYNGEINDDNWYYTGGTKQINDYDIDNDRCFVIGWYIKKISNNRIAMKCKIAFVAKDSTTSDTIHFEDIPDTFNGTHISNNWDVGSSGPYNGHVKLLLLDKSSNITVTTSGNLPTVTTFSQHYSAEIMRHDIVIGQYAPIKNFGYKTEFQLSKDPTYIPYPTITNNHWLTSSQIDVIQ